MRVPPPPFVLRAALSAPLLVVSALCLKLVELLTPEVRR